MGQHFSDFLPPHSISLLSVDAIHTLQFADVGNYHCDIPAGQAIDRRHIPEWPVVLPNPKRHGPLEGFIAVVGRLVDFVN